MKCPNSECGRANIPDGSVFCPDCNVYLVLDPGTLLDGRYKIINLLGSGGMGAVYKAQDTRFENKYIAVKEMVAPIHQEKTREYYIESFEREAKILQNLRHTYLPGVYDYFVEAGRFYMVTDFIDGKDLSRVLDELEEQDKELKIEEVISWGLQISEVLEYLHSRNPSVIHRDISPQNIILRKDGKVQLIDFGIASLSSVEDKKTKTGIGKMGYMSPEQFSGKPEPRSDMYSLAATMHHLLTREKPVYFSFEPVNQLRKDDFPPELQAVLDKALKDNPEDRYNNISQFADQLKNYLEGQGLASTGIIQGTVRDKTRRGIAHACVSVGDRHVLTDDLGQFIMTSMPTGKRLLGVSAQGYNSMSQDVAVPEDKGISINITLEKAKGKSPVSLAFIIIIVLIFGSVFYLMFSFFKNKSNEEKAEAYRTCLNNQEALHLALERYYTTNGEYPKSLNDILHQKDIRYYWNDIPKCPHGLEFQYSVVQQGQEFTLQCPHEDHKNISGKISEMKKNLVISILKRKLPQFLQKYPTQDQTFIKKLNQIRDFACYDNCKKIGEALLNYHNNNQSRYPISLNELVPDYLTSIPKCPVTKKDTYSTSYFYSTFNDKGYPTNFTFYCTGSNHSKLKQNFPQYDSINGFYIGFYYIKMKGSNYVKVFETR